MAEKRRQLTREFKAEVVKLVLDGGKSVPDVAREQGLADPCVYLWANQAKVDRGNGPADALTTSEKAELAKLRKENRELRRERDFFEQATVYFAKTKR